MSQTTEQINHNSLSTDMPLRASDGPTFVDPVGERELPEGYHPEKEHTLNDEISEFGKAFPKVAELLRNAIKYLG